MVDDGSWRSRYEEIARDIARRVDGGEFPPGTRLPTATAFAAEYRVARGTARHALESLEADAGVIGRRGARWIVQEPTMPQRLDSMLSFGQWARATGHVPSGRTIRQAMGRATAREARGLGIGSRDRVFRVERLRSLDGRPVLVERTTYPGSIAEVIAALPVDTASVMAVLESEHGIRIAHAELTIGAVGASAADAELLKVRTQTPLVRLRRTARAEDGVGFEHSDDRYLPDAVEFSLIESAVR